MKAVLQIFILLSFVGTLRAQGIRKFYGNDDFIRVENGDTITILTDTAYVVSVTRAGFINQKLDELEEVQLVYNDLVENRNLLLNELKNTHKILTRLLSHMKGDTILLDKNLGTLINDLDHSLADLKDNNETLERNNAELKAKIGHLQKLVGELKKETKGLWWNGITDKVVVFAVGVGVGILIALIF